jgi:hypothetical protein
VSPHTLEDLILLDDAVKSEGLAAVQRTVEWPAASAMINVTLTKATKQLPVMNSLWKLHVSDPSGVPKLKFGQVPVSAGVMEIGAELIFAPDKRNGIVECKWLPFASQSDTREEKLLREWLVPSEITAVEVVDIIHEFLMLALAGSLRLPIRWENHK